ncbi:MAG: diguanylate cyclase [Gemmatimonadaceae bacterium]|nr:diguanylate cyclase [Gemmatimonadaceae bacterium]
MPSRLDPHSLDPGRLAEARGEFQAAREYYERAMRELDHDAPPPAVAALLLQIARTFVASGRNAEARDCLEAVFALPDFGDMDAIVAEALELRGRLACEAGALDDAEADFREMGVRAAAAGQGWLVALGSEHLASVALVRDDWGASLDQLEAAAAGFRERGDDADTVRVQLQLARFYVDLKRWNAAEQALADALPRAQRASDLPSLARLELVRSQMAIDRSNVERARVSAERALDMARRAEHPGLATESVAMTGIVARELGDLDRALRLFEDAERQAHALDDAMLLGELACERTEVLARRPDHRRTLGALNHAYRSLARLLGQTGSVERARRLRRLERTFLDVTRHWAQRFEAVDHDTAGHVDRVADLTVEIARRMGIAPTALFGYRVGAYLHDLGKLAIAPAILNKRGRLTADEWSAVKRHPAAGAELLADTDFPWEVRPIVESHHECWNGSGYPHGRAGEEIPLAARIFCVADVFDALLARRAFKDPLTRDEAIEVMRRDVGRQFDPAVFRVFEDVVREGVAIPGVTSSVAVPVTPQGNATALADDPLTGAADFVSWSARASAALGARRGPEGDVAILIVDIDDFARVNATWGRLQGDDVLWAVAKVLQRGVRTGDLIGRRGSDEFVVLLPETTVNVATEVAERLRDAVGGLRCALRHAPDETLVVVASVAVAVAPGDGETVEALLAAGDRALFRARSEGGGRVVVADHGESARARHGLDFDVFTGREEELRSVVAQLDLAARGEPRLVGISGEAGVGKSALVRQLEPEVRLRNGLLATGITTADGSGGPLAPWPAVVSALAKAGVVHDRAWRALPALVPGELAPADVEDEEPDATLLQQEITAVVRRAARERPLVVVLEDMHLATPASWAVLDALLTAVDDEHLLVIHTMRPEVHPGAVEWRRRILAHARTTHVTLRRFGLDEVRRWIRLVFRDAAPGDDVARWIHDYAEGIPLHVLHLLRAGCDDGTIWYGGTRWEWREPGPRDVASGIGWVLDRRLDRLSGSSRSILSSAAVLQNVLTVELLVSVTGVPEGQARLALEEAVRASILVAVGDPAEGRYAFGHPLLVEACVRGMAERQRQQVHDLAARVMELRAPSSVDAIAGHYHAAGNDAAAFAYARAAAERSLGTGVHDAAIAALLVAQRHAPSSADLATIRVRHAEVALQAGRLAQAEAQADLALEWLDRQPVDATAIRGRRVRAWIRQRRGAFSGDTMDALRRLVDDAASVHPREEALSALAAAASAAERADWPMAEHFASRALELGVAHGDDAIVTEAMLELGTAQLAESPELGLPRLRQALERQRARPHATHDARALQVLGEALCRQEASSEGEDLLVQALERARASHHAPLAARISRALGVVRTRQGNHDEARQWLGDAERLFTTMEDEPERIGTLFDGARLLRDGGDRDRAQAQFDAVARRARDLDLAWMELAATAGAALSNGGPTSASTQQRWARTSALVADARPDWWFPGRELVDAFAVRMAIAGGHPNVAQDVFARAVDRLDGLDAYASVWLVTECAPELQRAGLKSAERRLVEAGVRARQLGFPLLARAT